MGTAKKEAARKERQGKVGDGMANVKVKGENFYRYWNMVDVLSYYTISDRGCIGRQRKLRL